MSAKELPFISFIKEEDSNSDLTAIEYKTQSDDQNDQNELSLVKYEDCNSACSGSVKVTELSDNQLIQLGNNTIYFDNGLNINDGNAITASVSDQVNSDQVNSDQANSNQVNSNQVSQKPRTKHTKPIASTGLISCLPDQR